MCHSYPPSLPRKRYRNLGLYWLGSFAMSILVFLPGNILGKYSSEMRPTFFLAILYMLVPCWAGVRIFNQSRAPTSYTPDMVQEEQKKSLFQRPADLALIVYLIFAALFTVFRGLVSLPCCPALSPPVSLFSLPLPNVFPYSLPKGQHSSI